MAELLGADGYPLNAERPTWEDIDMWATDLAGQVEDHCDETGERFDKIIVIPRGGYPVANVLARRFGFRALDIIHMGITSYKDGTTESSGTFEYGQMPTPEEIYGLNLLVAEEVVDTGETVEHATGLLQLAGAGIIRVAALHYKPERSTTGFVPDWYAAKTNKWVVYPWEKHEKKGKLSVVRRPNTIEEAA